MKQKWFLVRFYLYVRFEEYLKILRKFKNFRVFFKYFGNVKKKVLRKCKRIKYLLKGEI